MSRHSEAADHADARSRTAARASARPGRRRRPTRRGGPERFWANWVLWFLFLLTIGPRLPLHRGPRAPGGRPVERARPPHPGAAWPRCCCPCVPSALIALGALPVLYPGAQPEALQNPILAGKAVWLEPAVLLGPRPSSASSSGLSDWPSWSAAP